MQIELARSTEHLVLLGPLRAHPSGVEISVEIRSRHEHHGLNLMGPHLPGDGAIRFGVRYADGGSTSSAPSAFPLPDTTSTGPVLMPRGGGGGGGRYSHKLWLWPLPAEGDVEFFMKWDFGGFDVRWSLSMATRSVPALVARSAYGSHSMKKSSSQPSVR